MKNKKFFFITGASGSGANMIARILGRVDGVLGVGDTHLNFDHFLLERFNEAQKLAWGRHTNFRDHDRHMGRLKRLLEDLTGLEQTADSTHVIFKRSIMKGDGYRADLCDMRAMFPEVKIIAVYRNPVAASWSSFRRKLGNSLRHCAILQEEQLTVINGQIRQIPLEDSLVISYDKFCEDSVAGTAEIAEFCGLNVMDVLKAAEEEGVDADRKDAWKSELGPGQGERLWNFFSCRTAQWAILLSRSRS